MESRDYFSALRQPAQQHRRHPHRQPQPCAPALGQAQSRLNPLLRPGLAVRTKNPNRSLNRWGIRATMLFTAITTAPAMAGDSGEQQLPSAAASAEASTLRRTLALNRTGPRSLSHRSVSVEEMPVAPADPTSSLAGKPRPPQPAANRQGVRDWPVTSGSFRRTTCPSLQPARWTLRASWARIGEFASAQSPSCPAWCSWWSSSSS